MNRASCGDLLAVGGWWPVAGCRAVEELPFILWTANA